LKDPGVVQLRSTLTTIEPKCLDAAFKEMQAEGFADDGLFQRIKEFFFTFTISDHDLDSQWSLNGHVQQAWSARYDQLRVNVEQLKKDFQSETKTYQKCLNKISEIQENIKDEEANHEDIRVKLQPPKSTKGVVKNLQRMLSVTSKSTKQTKEDTRKLYLLLQESKQKQSALNKELDQAMTSKFRILQFTTDCEKQIEEKTAHMQMIKNKLDTCHEPINKQLVKSPRGLILYGPPGKFELLTHS
jgi:predicted  nucleic acid-binding Zn-ribbon protein